MYITMIQTLLAVLAIPNTGERGLPPIALILLVSALILVAILVFLRIRQNKPPRDDHKD